MHANARALKGAIARAGYNVSTLASAAGVNRSWLAKRLSSDEELSKMTLHNMIRVTAPLDLTMEQEQEIFLP